AEGAYREGGEVALILRAAQGVSQAALGRWGLAGEELRNLLLSPLCRELRQSSSPVPLVDQEGDGGLGDETAPLAPTKFGEGTLQTLHLPVRLRWRPVGVRCLCKHQEAIEILHVLKQAGRQLRVRKARVDQFTRVVDQLHREVPLVEGRKFVDHPDGL